MADRRDHGKDSKKDGGDNSDFSEHINNGPGDSNIDRRKSYDDVIDTIPPARPPKDEEGS